MHLNHSIYPKNTLIAVQACLNSLKEHQQQETKIAAIIVFKIQILMAQVVSDAAAPGVTFRGIAALPLAAAATPTTATSISVFELSVRPRRLCLLAEWAL